MLETNRVLTELGVFIVLLHRTGEDSKEHRCPWDWIGPAQLLSSGEGRNEPSEQLLSPSINSFLRSEEALKLSCNWSADSSDL